MTALPLPQHPVLACVAEIEDALDEATGAQPVYLSIAEKADVLRRLAVVEARVAGLRLRVLATAGDVAEEAGARDVAAWFAHQPRTELEAARWLTYRAASLRDAGLPFTKEAAMAKLKASRVAAWAASEAVQIHGGVGYMLESPVARFYCDSKVLEIGEGTNEIQHLVIARALGC